MRDTAIEMAKRLLVDSIWKSANLEGLGTTFPKTEAILANVPTTTNTEEVLFVINMKRAWQFLLENLDYGNNLMLLREYNKSWEKCCFIMPVKSEQFLSRLAAPRGNRKYPSPGL